MVTKEKLLYEQAYHALLGCKIGTFTTLNPFGKVCAEIGLTRKEWGKLKEDICLSDDQVKEVEEYLDNEEHSKELNPAHFCMGDNCDKFLGHRGFCSTKCHNSHYDALVGEGVANE